MAGFSELLGARGIKSVVQGVPGSFNVHLGIDRPVESLADTQRVDAERVETLTLALLRRGVRAIPGGHWYVNAAHTDALVDETLDVFEDALTEL
jgi:glutamate-1-semialdehyde 2,1-aminomutase